MGKLNYKIKNIGRKYLKIIHKDQFLKVKTQIVSKIKVFFKMNTPKQTVYGREKNWADQKDNTLEILLY